MALWYIDQGNDNVYKLDWQTRAKRCSKHQQKPSIPAAITLDDDGNVWIASTYSCDIFVVDRENWRYHRQVPVTRRPALTPPANTSTTRWAAPRNLPAITASNGKTTTSTSLLRHRNSSTSSKPRLGRKCTASKLPDTVSTASHSPKKKVTCGSPTPRSASSADSASKTAAATTYFRVPHPVQVHGMTIKDNRLWYADDRGPIGWLSVSMEPDF